MLMARFFGDTVVHIRKDIDRQECVRVLTRANTPRTRKFLFNFRKKVHSLLGVIVNDHVQRGHVSRIFLHLLLVALLNFEDFSIVIEVKAPCRGIDTACTHLGLIADVNYFHIVVLFEHHGVARARTRFCAKQIEALSVELRKHAHR